MGRSVETPPNYAQIVYFDATDWTEDEWRWDDLVMNLRWALRNRYPSMRDTDEWWGYPYRETRIIAENDLCRVTLSEYFGCAALALVPLREYDDPYYASDIGLRNLADQWCDRADLLDVARSIGLDTMTRIGGFSNGTSVYRRHNAEREAVPA